MLPEAGQYSKIQHLSSALSPRSVLPVPDKYFQPLVSALSLRSVLRAPGVCSQGNAPSPRTVHALTVPAPESLDPIAQNSSAKLLSPELSLTQAIIHVLSTMRLCNALGQP